MGFHLCRREPLEFAQLSLLEIVGMQTGRQPPPHNRNPGMSAWHQP